MKLKSKLIYSVTCILMVFLTAGCFGPLKVKYFKDEFDRVSPRSIHIEEILWQGDKTEEREKAEEFLSALVRREILQLGYSIVEKEKADAVLTVTVTEWDENKFLKYAGLDIDIMFQLRSNDLFHSLPKKTRMWKAKHSSTDSDLKLDPSSLPVEIYKGFEPRLERAVSTVFTTFPKVRIETEEEKYYDWLP